MSKEIVAQAKRIVDVAGQAGGIDEVRRLAERGWPLDRDLDGDSPELRDAIRAEAMRIVSEAAS